MPDDSTADELVVMSILEIDRLGVIQQVLARQLSRVKAGGLLGLGAKQVARLCAAYLLHGAAGIVSRRRGRPSNHKIPQSIEAEVVALVRKQYDDFGPTLLREKLRELHGIALGKETIRRILVRNGIWLPRDQRMPCSSTSFSCASFGPKSP